MAKYTYLLIYLRCLENATELIVCTEEQIQKFLISF